MPIMPTSLNAIPELAEKAAEADGVVCVEHASVPPGKCVVYDQKGGRMFIGDLADGIKEARPGHIMIVNIEDLKCIDAEYAKLLN